MTNPTTTATLSSVHDIPSHLGATKIQVTDCCVLSGMSTPPLPIMCFPIGHIDLDLLHWL